MTTPLSNVSALFKKINIRAVSPKRATLVIIVILGLLGAGAWVMITDKEQYLAQRNFRLLNLWSQETRAKVASYENVFETAAAGIAVNGEVTLHSHRENWEDADNSQRTLSLTTGHKEGDEDKIKMVDTWKCPLRGVQPSNDPQSSLQGQLCEAEGITEIILKPSKTKIPKEGFQVLMGTLPGLPVVQVLYTKPLEIPLSPKDVDDHSPPEIPLKEETPEDLPKIKISGTVDLTNFFTQLTTESPFEEVLVFQSLEKNEDEKSSPLIFHSGAREFSWNTFEEISKRQTSSSLLGNLLGSPSSPSQSTTLPTLQPGPNRFLIEAPGNKLEVFSYSFILPGQNSMKWVFVGLVSHKAFQNSYLAISSTILVGIMFLVLGVALGIPLSHLKMMGPTDPLRSSHVLALVLSALLGTGLLTYLFLDITLYEEGKQTLKQRLQDSSQTIKDRLFGEMERILFTLKQLDQDLRLKGDFDAVLSKDIETVNHHIKHSMPLKKEVPEVTGSQLPPEEQLPVGQRSVLREDKMKDPCGPSGFIQSELCYPDFLYAFWMDEDGSLRINWVREKYEGVGENIPLIGRNYAKTVLKHPNDLWRYSLSSDSQDDEYRFFLEPIISLNTGLNTVVASMPSKRGTSKQPWVAAMEFKLLSLMDHVVLPPGIGFAVLDYSKNTVLFHSNESRNLREDFIVEADHNPALQNLLSARTAGHAEGSYWGNATSFYTLPLHPLPWSLVVYRNNEMLRSVNLVGLLIAGTLYGLWSVLLYISVWFLIKWPAVHRKAPWLWPTPNNHFHYVNLLKWNVGLFVLGAIGVYVLSGSPMWQLLIALLGIPFLGLLGGWGILRQKIPSNRAAGSFRRSYSYSASSLLLIFAILPAFACFSSVFHMEMRLFSQFQILELFKSFEDSKKFQYVQGSKKLQYVEGSFICPQPAASLSEDFVNSHGIHRSSGIYPDFFLNTNWDICEKPKGISEDTSQYFDRLFALLSQPFLPLLKHTSLWGFIGGSWPNKTVEKDQRSNQREIIWDTSPTDTAMHMPLNGKPSVLSSNLVTSDTKSEILGTPENSSTDTLRMSAPFPINLWYLTGALPDPGLLRLEQIIGYPLMALAFLAWLILIPKYIANRTVFLSYIPQAPFPLEAIFLSENFVNSSNRLILGFPGQGKTSMASHFDKAHSCVIHLDLKTLPPDEWCSSLSKKLKKAQTEKIQHVHLIVDHLEYQWKNPACNMKKLELLETLLHRHSSSIDSEKSPQGKKQKLVIEVRDIQPEAVSTKIIPPTST